MDGSLPADKNKHYISSKKATKYFGTSKRSYNLNFIRERNRAPGEKLIDNANLKIIKAPKFSSKVYDKVSKSNKAEINADGNFKFVFQGNYTIFYYFVKLHLLGDLQNKVNSNISKSKFKFSGKRNSMVSSISGLQISKENSGNKDE